MGVEAEERRGIVLDYVCQQGPVRREDWACSMIINLFSKENSKYLVHGADRSSVEAPAWAPRLNLGIHAKG